MGAEKREIVDKVRCIYTGDDPRPPFADRVRRQMEKDFLDRIALNRVRPEQQILNKPIPDYYGEKIHSASQYRSWLRQQQDYKRKAVFQMEKKESERTANE